MLKQRIVTALLLLAILLPALFAVSPWPFALVTLVMIAAAGWEWSRLCGLSFPYAMLYGLATAVLCGLTLYSRGFGAMPSWVWWSVGLVWVLGGAHALRLGPTGWPLLGRLPRLLLGLLCLWAAWLAMVQARAVGINFLLSVFCLVWAADIAAYFGGRAFGRHKLAPAISPGKSWEGVWSGMLGVLALSLLWAFVIDRQIAVDAPSLYQLFWFKLGWLTGLLALLFLSSMSVVGDLFESLMKRAAGVKDSSALLPGHGGVLDRIDALLPVLPLAMALAAQARYA